MNAKKLHFTLLGLVALLFVGLAGGAYGANQLLSQRANVLIGLKAKDQALAEQQVQLEKAKRDIKKYADLEKIAKVVVPEDKDQAEAVRELVNIAAAHGITVSSINFPQSTLGLNSNGVSASTATPGSPAVKAPSLNSPTNKLSQLVAVPGIPGVYQLTININSSSQINYAQVISFLQALENNRRTSQVISINLAPNDAGDFSLIFSLNEYIKP